MTQRVMGVTIGLVDEIEQDGLGRIRVRFPLLENAISNWAPVATPMSSNQVGTFFPPERGDAALVAFKNGNVREPYILGYLWNGDNALPSDNPNLRMIRTVSGHKLIFDDTSGKEAITIEDANDNKIIMNADGITIESAKDVIIKGKNVNIEATAKLTAKGNPIHLNP